MSAFHQEANAPEDRAFEAPSSWRDELAGYAWSRQTIGRSDAAVFRLEAEGRPTLFVKTEPVSAFGEIPDEAARLKWLGGEAIPCPAVLREAREDGRDWLLMSAIPGRDLASSPDLAPERIVEIAAEALRMLHRLAVADCPFDHRLDRRIEAARRRMEAGLVDEEDFDEERSGRAAPEVFRELLAQRPSRQELVVTHGDACLPNLLADKGRFTGFVDCSRLGVADRFQDLALASWSIWHNLGEQWVGPFLERYGAEADLERMSFYQLLDEFF
ncbi:APH(3')-II family aminoglycoside O-phosphotransferase [Chelativorans sp.]|uniref:APH(3')-II family aminoglycoside O-phosphotransferase n=1 Tax=Chelativorans sp. TaxID=2203393 RepID=UPI002812859F|nr:APH(3')-II family aminoglycoside O-phosphotransferase [Chelativorans sp.]